MAGKEGRKHERKEARKDEAGKEEGSSSGRGLGGSWCRFGCFNFRCGCWLRCRFWGTYGHWRRRRLQQVIAALNDRIGRCPCASVPAQAEAAFDRLVGRIDEIAFGCDVAGKGKAAGKDQRAAYEDVAICVFHHVFPKIDYRARAGGREVIGDSHAPAHAGRVQILTG